MSEMKKPEAAPLSLAIIGRPNVGKSTLFNRLAHKQLAIVHDTPGVTRDWRETLGHLYEIPVRLIDTAGLEDEDETSLEGRMRRQTDQAIELAEVVLFMIDGRAGVTPLDQHFARLLRRKGQRAILVINKSENERAVTSALAEAYSLGLGEPILVSAEHGHGIEDIYESIYPIYEELRPGLKVYGDEDEDEQNIDLSEQEKSIQQDLDILEGDESFDFAALADIEDTETLPLKIAIVGRPNVGKSSLLNAILGDERVVTGPEAGITRDSIAVSWGFEGRTLRLVDTAGLRKRGKINEALENLSAKESLRAIRLSQVTVLVLDAEHGLQNQDLKIAAMTIEEGRALIIALNKWDLTKGREEVLQKLGERLSRSLSQVPEVPVVTVSALEGRNIAKLMRQIIGLYEEWRARLRTSPLNRWLKDIYAKNGPPLVNGRSNKLRYMTQIKTRPPTFAIWCARPEAIPDNYKRFLINRIRQDFKIPRVPIRLHFRTSKNPFKSED